MALKAAAADCKTGSEPRMHQQPLLAAMSVPGCHTHKQRCVCQLLQVWQRAVCGKVQILCQLLLAAAADA